MLAKNLSRFISSVLLSLLCAVSLASVSDSDTDFSLALYQQLDQDQQNTVVSPFSLRDCLAMAYLGSDKATQAAMNKVLDYGEPALLVAITNWRNQVLTSSVTDKKQLEREKKMNARMNLPVIEANTFTSVNSVWVDQSASFLKSYDKTIQSLSNASAYQVDYKNAPDQAVARINDWASKNTDGMITDLLTPNDIKPLTKLVLVNALYFKGTWQSQFNLHGTKEAPFYEDKDHQTTVSMMNNEGYFPYYEAEQYQLLELPYQYSSVSMMVLLPKDRDQDLTAMLNDIGDIQARLSSMERKKVNIFFPKFKITSRWGKLLKTMTQMIGVSNITLTQATAEPLNVSAIIQQAVIDVDEYGTTAAAVTVERFAGASQYEPPPVEFNADHPFIYMIYDHKTQNILFMGQMVSGSAAS